MKQILFVLLALAAAVLLGLRFFLRRTSFGRAIVAVTQDREAATAMGIDAARVYLITFIMCFDGDGWYKRRLVVPLAGLLALLMLLALSWQQQLAAAG